MAAIGRLSIPAINEFDSQFKNKATKAKQKRKAYLLRRANHAVRLRAGDNYSFHSDSRREGRSQRVYRKCCKDPLILKYAASGFVFLKRIFLKIFPDFAVNCAT